MCGALFTYVEWQNETNLDRHHMLRNNRGLLLHPFSRSGLCGGRGPD
jgi:hypothetical protein